MKKMLAILCLFAVLLAFAACGKRSVEDPAGEGTGQSTDAPTDGSDGMLPDESPEITVPTEMQPEPSITEEEPDMLKIEIIVGEKTFFATLQDNATAGTLLELLPLTLNMSELNGNEKYYYLDNRLPTNARRPSGIRNGDLMLYGDSCLVLFYESFATSYSYTPLGHIDDPEELAAALGSGGVQVTFRRG